MRVESIDDTVVRIRISDRLDVGTAEWLHERADECLEEGKRLLILFEPKAFCDSHGIRAILDLSERARRQFGEDGLALVSESRAADQVIEITRMARKIPVHDSEEEALRAFSAEASEPANGSAGTVSN